MSDPCWGTNKVCDCAWITFGWGSRWDMMNDTYEKGFWLSLEALKVFLIYDLPNGPHHPYREENLDSPVPANGEFYTDEEWAKLEPKHQIPYVGFWINHPAGDSKNVEWYTEAREVCGQYKLKNPDTRFLAPDSCTIIGAGGARVTHVDYPYREQIADINPVHGQIIMSTYANNDRALKNSFRERTWMGIVPKPSRGEYDGI